MDEMNREHRELASTNAIKGLIQIGPPVTDESEVNGGPVGGISSRIGVGEDDDGTSSE